MVPFKYFVPDIPVSPSPDTPVKSEKDGLVKDGVSTCPVSWGLDQSLDLASHVQQSTSKATSYHEF